jgi:hypothetical protein
MSPFSSTSIEVNAESRITRAVKQAVLISITQSIISLRVA